MNDTKYGKIVDLVHILLAESYKGKGNLIFVDATAGNGFDTLFLCNIAGQTGKVYSFDVQDQAIERTTSLLTSNLNYINYKVIKESHENISKYLDGNKIDAAIFNLGYLPFSDKEVKTNPETTINAIKNVLGYLSPMGRVYITVYISHDQASEYKEIIKYLSSLSNKEFNVVNMRLLNKANNPPEVLIIEKI